MWKLVQRRRTHAQLIKAIMNTDGSLPTLYKAKQFGVHHRAFVDKDERRLARAISDCRVAANELKEERRLCALN
jgi:hypothetical protein